MKVSRFPEVPTVRLCWVSNAMYYEVPGMQYSVGNIVERGIFLFFLGRDLMTEGSRLSAS